MGVIRVHPVKMIQRSVDLSSHLSIQIRAQIRPINKINSPRPDKEFRGGMRAGHQQMISWGIILVGLDRTDPVGFAAGLADAFAQVFVVATVMVALVLVPAFFLPRRKVAQPDPAVLVAH